LFQNQMEIALKTSSIATRILAFLPIEELLKFCTVSKQCQELGEEPLLWRQLFEREFKDTHLPNEGKEVKTLQRRFKLKQAVLYCMKARFAKPKEEDPFVLQQKKEKQEILMRISKLVHLLEDNSFDEVNENPNVVRLKLTARDKVLPVRAPKSTTTSQLIEVWCHRAGDQKYNPENLRLLFRGSVMESQRPIGEYPFFQGEAVRVAMYIPSRDTTLGI